MRSKNSSVKYLTNSIIAMYDIQKTQGGHTEFDQYARLKRLCLKQLILKLTRVREL